MSQIYDKYKELKAKNKNKIYLFKSGNFYIFLGDDANKINEYVVLKKTKFCKETDKCGFPAGSLDDYLKVFHNHKLNIEVIDSINNSEASFDKTIQKLRNLNIDEITPIKALNILKEMKDSIR